MTTASKRLRELTRYEIDFPEDLPGIALRAEMRIADLEAAIREMIRAIPGGQSCDPQRVADALRGIAQQHGVVMVD